MTNPAVIPSTDNSTPTNPPEIQNQAPLGAPEGWAGVLAHFVNTGKLPAVDADAMLQGAGLAPLPKDTRTAAEREFDAATGYTPVSDPRHFDFGHIEIDNAAGYGEQEAFEDRQLIQNLLHATSFTQEAGRTFADTMLASEREFNAIPEADEDRFFDDQCAKLDKLYGPAEAAPKLLAAINWFAAQAVKAGIDPNSLADSGQFETADVWHQLIRHHETMKLRAGTK